MNRPVRVRFAPSPTGPLHIGGVRTALFNYLFARRHGGTFILRIEDTDQTRYVPGAEEYIMESLAWCGIRFDEGIREGGPHAPYRQSERKDIYLSYARELIAKGHAYYAFDTSEALDSLRKAGEATNEPFAYGQANRMLLDNSLRLTMAETKARLEAGVPYVVRYKIPEKADLVLHDHIRGEVRVNTATLDDKVLFKSDGLPTYHLANVVDDHLMEISHVIRGEEWLPSMPLHALLYQSFGWTDTMPEFAHLPLLLKPSGKGKLSKRDGDQLGFPVFPIEWRPADGEFASGYRESGYFADAFVNMLAFLGWNPGDERELFSLDELAKEFSLVRVNKSGARFDPDKARWFNQQYLKLRTNEELCQLFMPIIHKKGFSPDSELVTKIVGLVKERAVFVADLWEQSKFFFEAPQVYDEQVVKKRWKDGVGEQLQNIAKALLPSIEPFDAVSIDARLKQHIESQQLNMGVVMNGMRLALVGTSSGPHLNDIMAVLGRDESIARICIAVKALPVS